MALAIPTVDVAPSALPLGWRRATVHSVVLAACMAVIVAHQLYGQLRGWYIEDAAISFAYARNLAEGEGLVAMAGGERVEGYSNALWVFLMAFWELLGVDGFTSAKWMSCILGALTAPLVYFIAREALPEHEEDVTLVAPVTLAASAQFAIWNASGLENSLFNFLMALGAWRVLVEARTGGWPWSALAFLGLSLTRPEGIMYAAFAGFGAMVFAILRARRADRFHASEAALYTGKWLLTFFVPWTVYNVWRYWYFAWELPNTFYAKDRLYKQLLDWNHSRGWTYTREWSHTLWAGYFLPLFIVGSLGLKRWRGLVAVLTVVFVAFVVSYPKTGLMASVGLPSGLPSWLADPNSVASPFDFLEYSTGEKVVPRQWWDSMKVLCLTGAAVLVPLLSLGGKGWRARVLCWGLAALAIFFCVWAKGDWMKGYRWYSLLVVPMVVLYSAGVGEVADAVQRLVAWVAGTPTRLWGPLAWLVAGFGAALTVPPNLEHTSWFETKRETGPFSVKRRVQYVQHASERVHLETRPVVWDVDMGAHLFWSDFWMMDMAGLIDVSVAHHHFEKQFMREYLFEEWRPDFAHVHGGWAKNSKIPTHPEWRRDYVEFPGYPAGKTSLHIGNHVRRDLLLVTKWPHSNFDRRVELEDGIVLEGFSIPSPEAAKARTMYIEVGVSTRKRADDENFRLLLTLSNDEHQASWDLPLGYDWIGPHEWREDEIFWGKYTLDLPKHLDLGLYDVGFVVLKADGTIARPLAMLEPPDGAPHPSGTPPTDVEPPYSLPPGFVAGGLGETAARFAIGEVRFTQAFHVVTLDENAENAREDRERAYEAANGKRCAEAEDWWFQARKHRPRNQQWEDEYAPGVETALASCWAMLSLEQPDRQVEALEKARRWDHWNADYRVAAAPVADALYEKAHVAREMEDWQTAYRLFTDVLRVDPQRSWARRYAEEARDHRLGIDEETKQRAEDERRERMQRMKERREELTGEQAGDADERPGEAPPGRPDEGRPDEGPEEE